MKDKILAKLLASIKTLKIEDTVDFSESKIINELVVPLMELLSVDTVGDLKSKLSLAFAEESNDELIESIATELTKNIKDEDDIESDENVISTFVSNCKVVLNTLETKDEDGIDALNFQIIEFINDEAKKKDSDKDDDDMDEDSTEAEEEKSEAGAITIVSGSDDVSETAWGDVNKTELKNALKEAYDSETPGAEEAIKETFALVTSMDRMGDWKWPHHEFKDNKIVLNVAGLKTAALFLLKPNSSKNLTTSERSEIAKHLLKHYKEIETEAPAKLSNLSEGKESVIVLNVQNEELKNFSETFNVDIEDVGTYIGLAEALLTDLLNCGIITMDSEKDESVVSIKLNKEQLEALVAQFDVMSEDIIKILEGKMESLSYKKTDETLTSKMNESTDKINKLMKKNDDLKADLEKSKTALAKLVNVNETNKLYNRKFEAIENFVKSIDGVDDSIINYINNVVDAENSEQINYLVKLSSAFLPTKNESTPKFMKNISIGESDKSIDMDKLIDLVGTSDDTEKHKKTQIDRKIDQLSDYL